MKRHALVLMFLPLLSFGALQVAKSDASFEMLSIDSPLWSKAKSETIPLYPQNAIESANEPIMPTTATLNALYNAKEIAIKISWKDSSASIQNAKDPSTFGDGVAIQFPLSLSKDKALPYIGMGEPTNPVIVHLLKATQRLSEPSPKAGTAITLAPSSVNLYGAELEAYQKAQRSLLKGYKKTFIAQGFRTTTEEASLDFRSEMSYRDGNWHALIVRPLSLGESHLGKNGSGALALALWDGIHNQRDGAKALSAWTLFVMEGKKNNIDVAQKIDMPLIGDATKGKQIALENCAACHQFSDA